MPIALWDDAYLPCLPGCMHGFLRNNKPHADILPAAGLLRCRRHHSRLDIMTSRHPAGTIQQ